MLANNPNKFLLGCHGSNDFESTSEPGSPQTFKAGLAVRRSPNGSLSLTDGERIGVSMGRDLSTNEKTVVCRDGNDIPVLLTATGQPSFANIGDVKVMAREVGEELNGSIIQVIDGEIDGGAVVSFSPIAPDGYAIEVKIESGVTTAETIMDALNSHLVIGEVFIATVAPGKEDEAQADGAPQTFSFGLNPTVFAIPGKPVYVDPVTGMATTSDDGDITNAIYNTGNLKGIDPVTKEEFDIALIDMKGGI